MEEHSERVRFQVEHEKRNFISTSSHVLDPVYYINIVYVIESAAYGVLFTSCLCQNPNERGTSE